MNSKLDFIFSRRSIRKYQEREVPEEMINDLLEAAMAAPSAVAKDPWHFIVVQSREILDRITEVLPNGKMLREAPVAFIVCGDLNKAHLQELSYMLQDLSAAVENILIAANALELGTCWLGVHPREDRQAGIRQIFDLPENIIPMCGIAIGWPAEQPEARTRYLQERVHLEKW
jgi:nitroreductase